MLTRIEISQLLVSLLTSNLAQMRHCSVFEIPDIAANSKIGSDDFPVDSLELIALATAVNTFFSLHKSGIEDYLLVKRRLSDWIDIVEQGADFGTITFATSGSTGEPKQVEHKLETLLEEARYLAKLLNPERIVALVPCHHIYGFITTILLPKVAKVPVLTEKNAPSVMRLGLNAGDVCIGFPLKWQYFTDTQIHLPVGVTCVTSTAPCEPAILQKLQSAGATDIIELYGSTETAGVGYRRYPQCEYQLFDYWKQAQNDCLQRTGTAMSVALMDQLVWQSECTFVPKKRHDGAVQVAGHNVFPEAVAQQIASVDSIKACYIRLDAQAGRLKALLIPSDKTWLNNQQALIQQIQQYCSEHLQVAERPASFIVTQQVPRNPMGKLSDW